jgi:hypothetical protein
MSRAIRSGSSTGKKCPPLGIGVHCGRCRSARPLAPAVAVDSKMVRGALREDRSQVHLLAAVDHDSGVVLGQRAVAANTNEIPELCRCWPGWT